MEYIRILFLINCVGLINCYPRPDQKSLVIVFDGTGSMFDDLQQLTSSAKDITNHLSKNDDDLIYNYILVKVFYDPVLILNTRDKDKLLEKLKTMSVGNGGDCPELILSGIIKGIQVAEPQSFVFVFTDASAKDAYLKDTVIQLVQEKQITLTFFVTGICNDNLEDLRVYEELAYKSNGQLYYLVNDEKTPALDDIMETLVAKNLNIYHNGSCFGGTDSLNLDIDHTTGSITGTLNGNDPELNIIDPDNVNYEVAEKDTLANSLTITIDYPKPGIWKFKYKSTSAHTLKVIGVGNLNFYYGFSKSLPSKLEDTTFTPSGGENVLSIFPTNSSLVKNLTYVSISGNYINEGHVEFKLPLKKHEIDNQVIYATSFKAPQILFKILLYGIDIENFPIKRMLSTELKSRGLSSSDLSLPVIGYTEMTTVFEGENFILACKINSTTNVTVQWKRDNNILKENYYPAGYAELAYVIKKVTIKDYGEYICEARNEDGVKSSISTLNVKKVQFDVNIAEKNYRVTTGQYVSIECLVSIDHAYKIKWLFNNSQHSPWEDGNEFNNKCELEAVEKQSAGEYTCVVKVVNTIKTASTTLTVLSKSLAVNIEIISEYYKPLYLNCTVQGTPPPKVSWHFIDLNDTKTIYNTTRKQYLIPNFSRNNFGDYVCEVDNGSEIKTETFIVHARAHKPVIKSHENKKTVIEGNNVEIICSCDNCYPITMYSWTCNTVTINYVSPQRQNNMIASRIDELENFTNGTFVYKLLIENTTVDDTCECKLGNDEGKASQIYEITVFSPPTYDLEDKDDTCTITYADTELTNITCKIYEEHDLDLECSMKGYPPPTYSWFRNGVSMDTDDTTLTLYSISKDENGSYKCQAANIISTMTVAYTILVLYKPEIVEINYEYDGDKFILHCSAIGYPLPIIEWQSNNKLLLTSSKINEYDYLQKTLNDHTKVYFDAKNDGYTTAKIATNGFIKLNSGNNNNVTLSLNVVDYIKEKLKRYHCLAYNEIDTYERDIILRQEVPSFLSKNSYISNHRINYNTSFILSCKSFGCPTPVTKWYKNNDLFDESSNDDIYFSDNRQVVHFKKADKSDMGFYSCKVKNWIGLITKNFQVNILYPPLLRYKSDKNKKIRKNENDNLSVECSIDAYPKPNYIWSKIDTFGRESVISYNKHLLINNIKVSSKYKCTATNYYGSIANIYDVIVRQAPEFKKNYDETKRVKLYDNVHLSCELSKGSEPLEVYWFNNLGILQDHEYNHQYSANKQILTIESNEYNETYSCLIINSLRMIRKYFNIIIY